MPHFARWTAVLLVALSATAAAVDRIPGTQTYWSYKVDPITDVNKSFVTLYEVNDVIGDTALVVRCSNVERPDLWLYFKSKHQIVDPAATMSDGLPDVTMRLGTDPAISLPVAALTSTSDPDGTTDAYSLGVQGATVQRIVTGLNAGKRLVVRFNRESGGQPLTYTFSASGFAQAWQQVRGCGTRLPSPSASTPSVTITPPLASAAPAAAAPKFTSWYFTTCTDAASGQVRTSLLAGRAALCQLVIETIPNGARVVRAEFRYELAYREAGQTGKLILDSVDTWPATSSSVTRFRQEGSKLIFTLPLNVRARPERVYTSINVTATLFFDNGSSKKVYEPLPVALY
ncbi:hypothetical protein [Deinococcus navajonensis]|uniref:Uncharacterized protein n=1 Tax=Deinococcus navajonensis TaxID=309884 RepID=A0ABV8XQY5_9DEIO